MTKGKKLNRKSNLCDLLQSLRFFVNRIVAKVIFLWLFNLQTTEYEWVGSSQVAVRDPF